MTSWRQIGAQIGGANAVTWWAWLISLPISVLISSVYVIEPTLQDVAEWTAALIGIHIILGMFMAVARLTILSARPRRPRPKTALAVFALLGALRAVLLQVAQSALGMGFFNLNERIIFNVVASVAIFSAIAIVIDEFKLDSRIVRELITAQRTLSRLREQERSSLESLDLTIIAGVERSILEQLQSQSLDTAHIRQISDSIVRPLSHELSEPLDDSRWSGSSASEISAKQTVDLILSRMQVPSPLAVVVIYQALVFGTVVARLNLGFAIINILGAIPTYLGLKWMRSYLPLPAKASLRIPTLVTGFLLVGLVAATMNAWMWRVVFFSDSVSIPAVAAGVVVLSTLLSLWIAVVEGREERRFRLSKAIEEQAREASRLGELANSRRRKAAHFLHGSVQNELIASALRGDSAEQIRESVLGLFAGYERDSRGQNARTSLEQLLSSWQTVLTLDVSVADAAWNILDTDEQRLTLLIDVVSEGLTNAVRHSTGHTFTMKITTNGNAILVSMTTEGVATRMHTPGIGLRELAIRGADVTLEESEGAATLRARL